MSTTTPSRRIPEVETCDTGAVSLGSLAASWARAFFTHRSRVAATLELAGGLAFASALPLRHWSDPTLLILWLAVALALLTACVRLTIGSRLPRWSLQIDVALGNLLVTLVSAVGAREQVGLANVYLLVEIFAILYFSFRVALAHTMAAGIGYGLVIAFSSGPGGPRLTAWLSVFATGVVVGAVVHGLASVLRMAAREDPLTGLANRRSFDERIEEELERARRSGDALSVAMIDLDGFKAVNDRAGHEGGDRLLRTLGHAWQGVLRGSGDFLARVGGDEFSLITPGADEASARVLVSRLQGVLPDGVAASSGVATWDGSESASDVLRRADREMYEAKRHRREETASRSA